MTRSELILLLAARNHHLSQSHAEQIVDTVFGEITKALASGAFSIKHRKARTGRNPRTGKTVQVAPKSIPFFKIGKKMHERLNGIVSGEDDMKD